MSVRGARWAELTALLFLLLSVPSRCSASTCLYYIVLGIHESADLTDIRRAYKKQALRWHPDKHLFNKARAEERFKLIAAAYTTLSDPEQCRRYDQVRRLQEEHQSGSGHKAGSKSRHHSSGSGSKQQNSKSGGTGGSAGSSSHDGPAGEQANVEFLKDFAVCVCSWTLKWISRHSGSILFGLLLGYAFVRLFPLLVLMLGGMLVMHLYGIVDWLSVLAGSLGVSLYQDREAAFLEVLAKLMELFFATAIPCCLGFAIGVMMADARLTGQAARPSRASKRGRSRRTFLHWLRYRNGY